MAEHAIIWGEKFSNCNSSYIDVNATHTHHYIQHLTDGEENRHPPEGNAGKKRVGRVFNKKNLEEPPPQ